MEVLMMILTLCFVIGAFVLCSFIFADLYFQVMKYHKIMKMKKELEKELLNTILHGEKLWKV
jgi:flagellar biosynthesis protein FlhB